MAGSLRVDRISHAHPSPEGPLPVLQEVSFDLSPGELLALTGPSGCGKTTLLHLIAGIVPRQSGEIRIDGAPVSHPGQRCMLLPQDQVLFPWKSVLDNVRFGLKARGMAKAEQTSRARHFLDIVQLGAFAGYYPHQLSEGMKQRLALARALAVEPDILLMDEPFAALDAQARRDLHDELLRLWEAHRLTILLVTHDLDEAVTLASRILLLSPRPAHLIADLPVDLPRPRRSGPEMTRALLEIRERVEESLRAGGGDPRPRN